MIFFTENTVDDAGKKYFLKVDSIFQGERRERKEERAGCYTEGAKLFIFFRFRSSRFRKIRSVEESENFAGNNALSGETMLLVLCPNYLSKETNSTVGIKVSERKRRLRDYCN